MFLSISTAALLNLKKIKLYETVRHGELVFFGLLHNFFYFIYNADSVQLLTLSKFVPDVRV